MADNDFFDASRRSEPEDQHDTEPASNGQSSYRQSPAPGSSQPEHTSPYPPYTGYYPPYASTSYPAPSGSGAGAPPFPVGYPQPAYGPGGPAGLGGAGGPAGLGGPGGPGGPAGLGRPSGPDDHHPGTSSEADRTLRRRQLMPFLVAVLIAALVGGVVGAATVAISDRNNGSVNTGLRITNDTTAPAAKTDGTVGAAASKIRASVVTINVSNGQAAGTGSGVILRDDGFVLTNDHVISTAASGGSIQVVLNDGRSGNATVVGRDTSDDLAVIKVTGLSGLTAATFGRSGALTVGQTVVAVGAPLGLSDTVTSGIVSNIARPVRSGDNDQAVFQAIQTDAPINPGNSGGPLVDLNGSVVGINAAIATDNSGGGLQIPGQSQQSGNIGIGFAIPSDEASRIASELIANGKAYHAVLGVSVRSTSSTTRAGVALSAVNSGGAADKAGLKVGDLITEVNSTRVTTADSLIAAIRSHAPGESVKVTYARNGRTSNATVTLDKSAT